MGFFYLDGDDLPLWIVCPVPLNPVLDETRILLVGVYDLVQNEEESLLIGDPETTQILGKKERQSQKFKIGFN